MDIVRFWLVQGKDCRRKDVSYVTEPVICRGSASRKLIDQAETLLPDNPAIGRPGRVIGTRELVIGRLPYIIAYRVRDKDLEILRVLHTSRAWPQEP